MQYYQNLPSGPPGPQPYYAGYHQQPQPRPHQPSIPGLHSQITCGGCSTLLMFAQGAQNVRCARCGYITAAQPQPQPRPPHSEGQAQLVCSNPQCQITLVYPRGASQVQCSICQTVSSAAQANHIDRIVCGQCQVTLMYDHGAQSVRCARCSHITPVSQTATQQHSVPQAKVTRTVVVENPGGEADVCVGILRD